VVSLFKAIATVDGDRALVNRAVCEAARQGDLDAVRGLHRQGADLHAGNNEALCQACQNGHLNVVRYLHRHGVKLNVRDDEPLCRACQNGHLNIIRYLHADGVKILRFVRHLRGNRVELTARDNEPLCRACEGGHLEIVRYLQESGIKLNARDDEPLCRACEGGHLEVVRYLHKNGTNLNTRDNEPLLRACDGGHLDILLYLQQNGASLVTPNNEPLCRAAAAGHLELVRYIYENGGDISPPHNEPLCRAIAAGNLELVRYIHQNGGDIGARDGEPLCRAATAGHLDLVRYIHESGGDISVRNNEPLRRAAAGEHASVVRYLHDAGAATQLLTIAARHSVAQIKQELHAAPAVDHPSAFWREMGETNERILGWSGEANFKRTLNQNYFNFIPTASDDARMVRMHRLVHGFTQSTLDQFLIGDPDCDPNSWMSFYPDYYIFKEPNRTRKREIYREYLALMYEYAVRRDCSGLLASLEEPKLGNPIEVHRNGRLISQDLINSVRERNSIIAAIEADGDTQFRLAELGAGYGRLGYVLLKTTQCRYFVFDIPPALYLSQWYLTTLFPNRRAFRFRRFNAFEEIESELAQTEIAFFTPNQLMNFPARYFDVFANISSIHEMRRDQISHYMALMGRTTKSTLYLKQQKDYVNPIDNLIIGKNDYPLPVGWSPWQERFDLINPGFFERVYRRDRPSTSSRAGS
jgi:putative sugar O-methyltransferase